MAAREATQPRPPLRAAALAAVFVLAKLLMLAAHPAPPAWAFPSILWTDLAVALGFWAADAALGRPRWMWGPYAAFVVYAAINVPVAWLLSSPLTVPMLRAAGAPLADSIVQSLTLRNTGAIVVMLAAGAALPRALGRLPVAARRALAAAAAVVLAAGVATAGVVDTRGWHRNAVTALFATVAPRIAPGGGGPDAGDWRASPFGAAPGEDLTSLGGAAGGRHVLLVMLESVAARYLAPWGAPDDPMPNLTALARDALLFEHAYAVYPESVKGLVAVLGSRYPGFDVSGEAHGAVPVDGLPTRLAAAGYRTALFHSGRFGYLGMDAIVAAQGFDVAEDAGAIGGQVHSSFGVDEPSAVARILAWIDAGGPRPFFAAYLPAAGHHPYATDEPGPFRDPGEFGAYKNAIHSADRALGSLLDALRDRGLLDRTLLVIAGDHGEAFGRHDGNFGHSLFVYEDNVRVPFLIAAPGPDGAPGPVASRRVGRVVSLLDIAPTVLDLLGLPASPRHQGTSALEPGERMALFFTDYALGWLGLRDGCWKYLFQVESARSALYDVCRDPAETTDLSPRHGERVRAYRERVERWSEAERDAVVNGR